MPQPRGTGCRIDNATVIEPGDITYNMYFQLLSGTHVYEIMAHMEGLAKIHNHFTVLVHISPTIEGDKRPAQQYGMPIKEREEEGGRVHLRCCVESCRDGGNLVKSSSGFFPPLTYVAC